MMQRRTYLALFSLMLAMVMAAWIRFSAILFAVKFSTFSRSVEAYTRMFTSGDGWITLSFFVGIGFLLAAVVFAISAVAIPLILDKDADFVTAMQTSYRVVTSNPGAMAVWAISIVALTAVGIATAFVGFAVIFPVLGYATWHSYRALRSKRAGTVPDRRPPPHKGRGRFPLRLKALSDARDSGSPGVRQIRRRGCPLSAKGRKDFRA